MIHKFMNDMKEFFLKVKSCRKYISIEYIRKQNIDYIHI